jgi:hypothetical protein
MIFLILLDAPVDSFVSFCSIFIGSGMILSFSANISWSLSSSKFGSLILL